MTNQQAKEILRRYRPGIDDDAEPEMAAALDVAKSDRQLGEWLSEQQAFHATIRDKLGRIEPPPGFKERILVATEPAKVIIWWRRPEFLAIAAGLVLLLALARFWLPVEEPSNLQYFRARMAKLALRGYTMDLLTNDLAQIRAHLAQHGAPADYSLSAQVERLPAVGCKSLKWHDQPVSLVCFGLGKGDLLWLFVINRAALPPASDQPQFQALGPGGKLMTAAWTQGDKTYLMAMLGNRESLLGYLGSPQ